MPLWRSVTARQSCELALIRKNQSPEGTYNAQNTEFYAFPRHLHDNFDEFKTQQQPQRLFALSTKGKKHYHQIQYKDGDYFIFGPETRGLPDHILQELETTLLRIPMKAGSRSLNLSNTAAIMAFEALRQLEFEGCE